MKPLASQLNNFRPSLSIIASLERSRASFAFVDFDCIFRKKKAMDNAAEEELAANNGNLPVELNMDFSLKTLFGTRTNFLF